MGLHAAELEAGLAGGLAAGQTLGHQRFGARVQVKADLLLHLGFKAAALQRGAQPKAQASVRRGAHWVASGVAEGAASLRIAPTSRAMRLHFSASSASCFCPSGVSV